MCPCLMFFILRITSKSHGVGIYQQTCSSFFFVVWQGIRDPGQTHKKDGNRGFSLLPPQPALLPRSYAGSDRS